MLVSLSMSACKWLEQQSGDDVAVARAYEKSLFKSEIEAQVPAGMTAVDSTVLANRLIENWLEKQVLLENARRNLEEDETIVQKVEDYRNDLMIYAYQSSLVNQKLDTVVEEQEIRTYYNSNKQNFELKDYIIKAFYVKLDSNAPNMNKVKNWISSDKQDDFALLEDYCHQFAVNYFLDENTWLYLDDLKKEINFENENEQDLIQQRETLVIENGEYTFILAFKDHRLKESTSPLSLEKEKIKRIILNQRKQDLIDQMKRDLYQRAQQKKNIEIIKLPED